jgi:hypothetical protein
MSSDKRTMITKDSKRFSRRALSRCIEHTKGDRTARCYVRRYSARWALSRCGDKHKRRKELLEFWN